MKIPASVAVIMIASSMILRFFVLFQWMVPSAFHYIRLEFWEKGYNFSFHRNKKRKKQRRNVSGSG